MGDGANFVPDVACSDGTVPPHDESGWWFEPFQDSKGCWRCGRKKDHVRTPCLRRALRGNLNHTCKSHSGRPQIHGLRSKNGPGGALRAKIEAARKDPQLLNINNRVAMLAGAMDLAVEKLEEAQPCSECGVLPVHTMAFVESLARVVDKFSNAVARHEQIANGLKVRLIREGRAELAARFGHILTTHEGRELDKGLIRDIVAELGGEPRGRRSRSRARP